MNAKLLTWATLLGSFLVAVGMATAGVVYVVTVHDEAAASTRFDTGADRRIATIETLVSDLRIDAGQTKTDVSWIRHFLEHPAAAPHKDPPAQTASVDP